MLRSGSNAGRSLEAGLQSCIKGPNFLTSFLLFFFSTDHLRPFLTRTFLCTHHVNPIRRGRKHRLHSFSRSTNTNIHLLQVTGRSEIPHPAERAVISVVVESSGTNKASVSDEVLTTAKHLESLIRAIAPKEESPEAKQASPLAHWAKKGFTATSHVPWYDHSKTKNPPPRQYNGSITFDIRFKEFKALGAFGEKLTALPHVEVKNVSWILTPATTKSYRSQLRKEAAQDALEKARDYCSVLGCSNIRPVELSEGHLGGGGGSLFGAAAYAPQARQMQMQQAPGMQGDSRDESPLEFRPEEVKMSMDVTVKFHAD